MELTRVVIDGYVEGATCCLTFLFPSICSIFLLRFLMVGKNGRNSKETKLCSLTARNGATLVNYFHITSHSSGGLL